jgi:hypothetical protein
MSISKIPSMVAMPVNKTTNQLYFTTSDERPVDMKASYVELEMSLDTTQNHNVVLGHDGLMYPPSCLFRSSKLTKTQTGEVVQDLNYVNVLDANLRHYSVGCNQVVADSIYSGAGHRTPQGEIVSIFNNDYPDQNPTLKVPLESLYPGSLGTSSVVPMGSGDVEFRYLLEPQYPVLMRAVPYGVYDQGTIDITAGITNFSNITANTSTVTAGITGIISNYVSGNEVVITGIVQSVPSVFVRTVNVVTPDAGATAGNFTFTGGVISASQALSQPEVYKVTGTQHILSCASLQSSGTAQTVSNLTLKTAYALNSDLYVGTDVIVHYDTILANIDPTANVITRDLSVRTTISAVTSTTTISAVQITGSIPLAISTGAVNVWIEPLYTNLDSNNWSVVSAHLVLYRRNLKVPQGKAVVQNFESVNVQCVGGLNRFMYNYKVRPNTFNAWAIQPTNTNLYSVRQGIAQYLFSLDERPLTSVYIDTDPLSAVHQDNIMRCGGNSPVYKIKNLRGNRDREIQSEIEPIMFPAKLFSSMVGGDENVQPEGMDKNLRIELVPTTTTLPCNVFLFMEKHQEI